jgi:hypothetical protein
MCQTFPTDSLHQRRRRIPPSDDGPSMTLAKHRPEPAQSAQRGVPPPNVGLGYTSIPSSQGSSSSSEIKYSGSCFPGEPAHQGVVPAGTVTEVSDRDVDASRFSVSDDGNGTDGLQRSGGRREFIKTLIKKASSLFKS